MVEQPQGTVSLLFTDIEGSTRLLQELGRERYAEALDLHRELLRQAFSEHGGYEVDYEGDAFFVAFARPEDAVSAAVSAQQTLVNADWPDGHELRVRMGIHTGEPLAVPPKYVGLDVHKAARIMSAGHGGQVLLSEATSKLITDFPDGVSLRDLGEHRLKDLLQPEPLTQLAIAGLPSEFPALKTLSNRPTNLPVQPNPLIGREREICQVAALLRDEQVRLVTLTGPGGTGKTRLALQVSAELLDEFRSGVFFVSLAPISDANLVVPTITQTLAVREVPGEDLADTLIGYLAEKQMLLVLDNFEQVVEAAPSLSRLLAAAPEVGLLVTSRERLRISPERVFEVPPLELPDPARLDAETLLENEAVALFVARAQAARPQFELRDENAEAVAEICLRLDGLPLALELAAARIAILTPQALLARLDRRLALLTGGARDADERQQTLRKTIEWSYDLLPESEQTLFARLSVFVGGCRLEAAEAVCDPDGELGLDVLDGLTSLVEKSLLRRSEEADGELRFLMLQTINEYAVEQLSARGEAASLRERHAWFFARLVEKGSPPPGRPPEPDWLGLVDREYKEVRAALAWSKAAGEVHLHRSLLAAMGPFWNARGPFREARDWLAGARGEATVVGELGERLRFAAFWVFFRVGDYREARVVAEEALRAARLSDDLGAVARALVRLAAAAEGEGKNEEARVLLEEALALHRERGDPQAITVPAHNLSVLLIHSDPLYAKSLQLESLAIERNLRQVHGIVDSLTCLGWIEFVLQEYDRAEAAFREGLILNVEVGSRGAQIGMLNGLAALAAARAQAERATRLLGAADALREQSGYNPTPAQAAEIEEVATVIRRSLDETEFEALFESGRLLSAEQAVEYALEEPASTSSVVDPSELTRIWAEPSARSAAKK